MKYRDKEYLQSLTRNNRTVQQNVENGMKAWLTRQRKLVENAVQKGVDISSIIFEYQQAIELYDNDYSIPGIISRELGYIKPEGFYRFGDRNYITNAMKRNYFRQDGLHIDELSDALANRYNRNITPSDIAEFICEYPNRNYEPFVRILEAGQSFRELIGFNITMNFIRNFNNRQEPTALNCPF